ncbi:hypothetical protein H634G_11736 [Metarhizium anisopliae BRIP 53293]|uniref:Uncharacterized protein n=1 Tax=Metarhizium anisopliae BRIP 53293 TaxID=1291518 RepID=A0A0D9NH13_METAN|nr:hypothetical protein H634G_11736 [Metarhizium anisopliae BRIP 53293]
MKRIWGSLYTMEFTLGSLKSCELFLIGGPFRPLIRHPLCLRRPVAHAAGPTCDLRCSL